MNQFDFIFAGPQRTASSWLREVLIQHPEIKLPDWVKETHTFSAGHYSADFDKFWQEGSENLKVGEFGPLYFNDPLAIQRIKQHNPNCKIIIGVRDPVEKTLSLFQHYYAKGLGSKDFEKTCFKHPEIIYSGNYRFWVPEWEKKFPKSNLYLFNYANISLNPKMELNNLSEFLKIDFKGIKFDSTQKIGSADLPKSFFLKKTLRFGAKTLRNCGFHKAANFGKSIGLKKMVSNKQKIEVDSKLKEMLKSIFEDDTRFLKERDLVL